MRRRSSSGFWFAHHFTAVTPAQTTRAKRSPRMVAMLAEL